ncbi:AI-2E family transporter [Wenyingzhuangia sp. IMCC45467]
MKLLKINYIRYAAYSIFILMAGVFTLIQAKTVLAPLVISILLCFVLNPIFKRINKFVKNRLLSTIILLSTLIISIGGLLSLLTVQLLGFYEDLPSISEKMVVITRSIEELMADVFGVRNFHINQKLEVGVDQLLKSNTDVIGYILDNVGGFLVYISIIPIYVFFILCFKSSILKYVKKIMKPFKIKAIPVISEVSVIIQDYLKGVLTVMFILAIVNSLGLLALGVPYAVALGVLAALFTIVPYIGVVIGGLLVLSVSLLTQGSPTILLYILILFGVIQFVEGNFLTPKIVGDKININPMLAILALLIGEKIWGIIGMVVALPITAVILIMIKNITKETFYTQEQDII